MALVYRSICNEIDSLVIQIAKLAEKEVRYKIEIENLMNRGFLNIAKARYVMGSTCVTKMQLPTRDSSRIRASATVCRALSDNHWVFRVRREDALAVDDNSDTFENEEETKRDADADAEDDVDVDDLEKNKTLAKSERRFKKLLRDDPKALKKCKNAFDVEDEVFKDFNEELLDELSTGSSSNESVVSVTDPIRLFGVLVPASLKQAQSLFKDVINMLGFCATLQSELEEVLSRYSNLERVKDLIEKAAKEIKIDISKPKIYWTPSDLSSVSCYSSTNEKSEQDAETASGVSIQKSIRSVFYDLPELETREAELSVWGSEVGSCAKEND